MLSHIGGSMEILISFLPGWALPYINKLTLEQWRLVGLSLSALLALSGLLGFIYGLLRALGWRRYQGSWYSPDQFQLIVQELYSGVRAGRVPDYETMKLLDEYVYGRKGSQIRNLTKADHI